GGWAPRGAPAAPPVSASGALGTARAGDRELFLVGEPHGLGTPGTKQCPGRHGAPALGSAGWPPAAVPRPGAGRPPRSVPATVPSRPEPVASSSGRPPLAP